jgi:plastocyanin
MLGKNAGGKRKAIGTAIIVGVVVVLVVAAAAGYFLLSSSAPGQSSSNTTTSQSSSTGSSTVGTSTGVVRVTIPKGAGIDQSINFTPATIKVVLGVNNTIVWTNQDPIPHTVTSSSVPSGAAAFDSGTMSQGQTYQATLTVPGTYKYLCTIHPTWMVAQIIVVG